MSDKTQDQINEASTSQFYAVGAQTSFGGGGSVAIVKMIMRIITMDW
jgi:hypothetical protein